jgi:hypothetical protein
VTPAQIPQRIHVVAAYVDGSGAIVPPTGSGNATLTLTNVSNFKGIAMNASKAGVSDFAPDFAAVTTSAAFGNDNTARFDVDVYDYGGFAVPVVTHGSNSAQLPLPVDADQNWLPDVGWKVGTATILQTGLAPGADIDDTPAVTAGVTPQGLIGDGLANFEEYRGFIVQGQHLRTDPRAKDLFVSSNLSEGIEFAAPNLPLATHRVNGQDELGTDEYRTADRVINFNYQNPGYGGNVPNRSESNNQKALRVFSVPSGPAGVYAATYQTSVTGGGSPNETDRTEIYLAIHDDLKKAPYKYNPTKIANEKKRTIGHEIGHGVSICHRPNTPSFTCPDPVGASDSIMSSPLFGGPGSTSPYSQYNSFDVPQIRLHLYF